MATKAERGTKRTCQNPECGSRFYDLNRDPIVCPICGSTYEIAVSSMAGTAAEAAAEEKARKAIKKPVPELEGIKPEDVPEAEAEEALVAIEDAEEAPVTEEDETFLEQEEEDGSDVSGIIGGPVAEEDEAR
jgi:uncharacterized protein (TIGR02300 family)